MKLSDIKRINQRIYTLDTEISRNSRPTTTARKQIVELCKENNIELKEVNE